MPTFLAEDTHSHYTSLTSSWWVVIVQGLVEDDFGILTVQGVADPARAQAQELGVPSSLFVGATYNRRAEEHFSVDSETEE